MFYLVSSNCSIPGAKASWIGSFENQQQAEKAVRDTSEWVEEHTHLPVGAYISEITEEWVFPPVHTIMFSTYEVDGTGYRYERGIPLSERHGELCLLPAKLYQGLRLVPGQLAISMDGKVVAWRFLTVPSEMGWQKIEEWEKLPGYISEYSSYSVYWGNVKYYLCSDKDEPIENRIFRTVTPLAIKNKLAGKDGSPPDHILFIKEGDTVPLSYS